MIPSIKELASRDWPVPAIKWDPRVPMSHREAIATVLPQYVEPLKADDPEGVYPIGTELCIRCEYELVTRWGVVHNTQECARCGYPVVVVAVPFEGKSLRIAGLPFQPHPRTLLAVNG